MGLDIPVENNPVLGFHDIGRRFDWSLNSIRPNRLLELLNWLKSARDFRPELLFDDAYRSVFQAAEENPDLFRSFKPKISVITSQIGETGSWDIRPGSSGKLHCSEKELQFLSTFGWEVISHSHLHLALDQLGAKALKSELAESKSRIEHLTGKPVVSLSFPFGRVTPRVLEAAQDAGYRRFYSNKTHSDLIRRVWTVYRWDSDAQVLAKLSRSKWEETRLNFISCFSGLTVLAQKGAGYYRHQNKNKTL